MAINYIRVASDLHLEAFSGQTPETLGLGFLPKDDRDVESILVLAGDISSHGEQLLGFLAEMCKRFPKVFFVPGNHEFYRHDYPSYCKELNGQLSLETVNFGAFRNLRFALDDVGYEELDDLKLRFIFTPLWGDGGPTLADQGKVGFYLNDFRLISNGTTARGTATLRFTVQDMVDIHKRQKAELDALLRAPFDGKTVVITHHLPSRRLVSARFWPSDGSDGANGGFVGDCDNILAYDHAPVLWIHGHTHDSIDTRLWKTRIICHPAGYRGEWISPFNSFMTLDEEGKRMTVPKFIELASLGDA